MIFFYKEAQNTFEELYNDFWKMCKKNKNFLKIKLDLISMDLETM
jgi:protein tyrosine phosphatase